VNVIVSQALACGLPVIATRHSGLPEQVVDGENGFVVEEGDYVALAERILQLAAHPELLARLGAAGRRHVAERYDTEVLIERQIACYRELVATRSTA
jgi:glycosyltransferase involved in cell wall biosynthesis